MYHRRTHAEAPVNRTMNVAYALALVAVLPAGCGIAGMTAADPSTTGCTTVLSPSGTAATDLSNVNTAFGNATTGSVICFRPGRYQLLSNVDVVANNVTLRGTSTTDASVLDFNGQTSGAYGVGATAVKNFKLDNLTVKNTVKDAIKVTQSDGVTFSRVTVTWDRGPDTMNGAYGLYPVQCTRVTIDGCKVSYAADAGIYVGQSNQIIVKNSEATGNVAGIEIENSNDAEVFGNNAHDNTGGILVFSLPSLMMEGGARALVHDNKVVNNNGKNFADKAGIVSQVPVGTGMLIMAADNNEVHNNTIMGNDSAGIAIVSFLDLMRPTMDMKYDPFPEGNWVHDNTLSGDGTNPDGLAYQIKLAAGLMTVPELIWDGLVDPAKMNTNNALTNCYSNNGSADFVDLGADVKGNYKPSTDIKPFTCMHAPLPPVMF
jgi:parallel beta-helix repeat protein